jgi:hypothetical protein
MTLSSSIQRGFFRIVALLALSGYVAIMAPLVRQDLQLATLGDTLRMSRRSVDAQLVQNDRDIQAAKKRREDLGYLKDERRMLTLQGLEATREIQDWQVRKDLWAGMYWAAFALAHGIALPLGIWMLAGTSALTGARPARPAMPARKRSPRTSRPRAPKLVPGTDPR